MPAQQLTAVAVDHQRQGCPAIAARPNAARIRGPAFIERLRHRWQGLDAQAEPHRALAHLPALELEDALNGNLIEPQQVRHGTIAERRVFLNHGLDRPSQVFLHGWRRLGGAVVQRTAWHLEPPAQFDHADLESLLGQCLLHV